MMVALYRCRLDQASCVELGRFSERNRDHGHHQIMAGDQSLVGVGYAQILASPSRVHYYARRAHEEWLTVAEHNMRILWKGKVRLA